LLDTFSLQENREKGKKRIKVGKKKESKIGKLQVRNWVPIPVCIFQPSFFQLQSPLVPIADDKKTNPHWKANQTKRNNANK
jgi:hypothetical protein